MPQAPHLTQLRILCPVGRALQLADHPLQEGQVGAHPAQLAPVLGALTGVHRDGGVGRSGSEGHDVDGDVPVQGRRRRRRPLLPGGFPPTATKLPTTLPPHTEEAQPDEGGPSDPDPGVEALGVRQGLLVTSSTSDSGRLTSLSLDLRQLFLPFIFLSFLF